MQHKHVQVILDMNVCKHLFYHLMKKETFQYQPLDKNVCLFYFHIKFNFIIYILGLLSPHNAQIGDSRDNLSGSKSGGDSVSVERTRKEKFRLALRSVSKVAFSQLGLGKLHLRLKMTIEILVNFFRWSRCWLCYSWRINI
jgi:hypothetical protein